MNRRGLITGLVSLIAAPAVVKAELLMPVKTQPIIINRIEILYPYQRDALEWLKKSQFDYNKAVSETLAFFEGFQWNEAIRSKI